ncbi:MAG: thiopurine S-methyltransferase [Rhodospirillales bacterium]
MEHDFWRERWQTNQIGFHEKDGNKLLARHFDVIALPEGSRYFLPLCGKTGDIARLLGKGYRVAGAELMETAIQQLFEELGVAPEITDAGALKRYSAPSIDIFVGDVFQLTAEVLGPVDAVYDRAALVAFPDTMRAKYTAHLAAITDHARQMLITFEYDQNTMDGPPFNVDEAEIRTHYAADYEIGLIRRIDIPKGLKGQVKANEVVWLLKPRSIQKISSP